MLLSALIMTLIVLLWKANSHWEWSIPLKLQSFLQTEKENLSRETQRVAYAWKESGGNELEKDLGNLQREFPRLRKKYKDPIWIEVCLHQNMVLGPREKYLACLQRRFPDIDIYTCRQDDSNNE